MTRQRAVLIALVAVALGGLLTIVTWVSMTSVTGPGHGPDMMNPGYGPRSGSGMMPGHSPWADGPGGMGGYVLPGNGVPVNSLDGARQRAQLLAVRWQLRAGEVMQFDNGFYAELRTTEGQGATEVLIDPASGGVRLEYGPAMMWNTGYGMHAGRATTPVRVSPAEAGRIAQRWLDERRRGLTAHEPERFPGYYTMHTTTRDGKISGMMSVNAYTGAVWYHTWHGRYVAMSEG